MMSFSLILLVVHDGWSCWSSPSLAFWINWFSSSVCPSSHCIPWPIKKTISSLACKIWIPSFFLTDIRRNLDSPSWIWHWNIPGIGFVPGSHRANPLLLAPPNAISTCSHIHCVPPSKCAPFPLLPWIICTAKIASHDKILRKRDIFSRSALRCLNGKNDGVVAVLAKISKWRHNPNTEKLFSLLAGVFYVLMRCWQPCENIINIFSRDFKNFSSKLLVPPFLYFDWICYSIALNKRNVVSSRTNIIVTHYTIDTWYLPRLFVTLFALVQKSCVSWPRQVLLAVQNIPITICDETHIDSDLLDLLYTAIGNISTLWWTHWKFMWYDDWILRNTEHFASAKRTFRAICDWDDTSIDNGTCENVIFSVWSSIPALIR